MGTLRKPRLPQKFWKTKRLIKVCRPVIFWTYKGERLSILEWSERTQIPYQTLYHRKEIWGFSVARALGFEPPPPHRRWKPIIIKTSDGREGTYAQWSEWTGLPISTIKTRRLRMKWDDDKTMNTPPDAKRSRQSIACQGSGAE